MRYDLCRQYARTCFLRVLVSMWAISLYGDPTRLNNADPCPLFSSAGKYDLLAIDAIRAVQQALDCDNEPNGLSERLHIAISGYYQSAVDGADYRGNDTVTYYDNTNLPSQQSGALLAASSATGATPQPSSSITNVVSMPLGAIPEAFNYFALTYPYSQDPQVTNNNQPGKVLARYLGYGHAEFLKTINGTFPSSACVATPVNAFCYDPLQYGYGNYRNDYFNVLALPNSRDPGRLFGYGYFDFYYQKYGARAQIEFRATPCIGMRIYTGVAHVQQDRVSQIDTTTVYQGPTAATMFTRYPDTLNQAVAASTARPSPYLSPSIYQLTSYVQPAYNGDPTTPQYDLAAFNNDSRFANEFKSLYLQNIQNNYLSLAQGLNINLSPYNATAIEDTTFEMYWRTLTFYNSDDKSKWPPYVIMPVVMAHFTVPISPQVSPSLIFGKPIANNGHWEFGGSIGCVCGFLNSISVGFDIGASCFTQKCYLGMPVPTHYLQEGIYPYTANVLRDPGINFTLGLGMQADHFLECFSFSSEYRLVKHNSDCFTINDVISPFSVLSVQSILQNNTTQSCSVQPPVKTCPKFASTKANPNGCSPDSALWGCIPIPLGTAVDVVPGILYTDNTVIELPVPTPDDVYTQHLVDVSAWTVHMLNFSLKYDISTWTSLGLNMQFPVSVTNAYNSGTLSVCLEMML